MVVDAFMWHNEIDVLELRLTLLGPHVDLFVAVESDHTHSGVRKGHRLGDHRNRLWEWWDRIVWVRHQATPDEEAWPAENRQRRACRTAVADLDPAGDDIVVISDVDELWTPDCLGRWEDGIAVARQDFRLFSIYWRWQQRWPGSIGGLWRQMAADDWQELRDQRHALPYLDAGWHFSWMGEPDDWLAKRDAFAHRELAAADVTGSGVDGRWLDGTELDETADGLPDGIVGMVPASWLRTRAGTLTPVGG